MTLLEKVRQTIEKEKLLEFSMHTNTILVGVSGGPDSVCLLHLLTQLSKELSFNIIVAHINHQLRGKESDRDEEFVRKLCRKWKLKFVSKSVNIRRFKKPGKSSIEEIAREKRYEFFGKLAQKYLATKIVLGHHADDQIETILMRLLRGAGSEGLAGIRSKRFFGHIHIEHGHSDHHEPTYIVRPLLEITRIEILDYLNEKKLSFREDSTNTDTAFLRNKIRHKLIPYLEKEYNPQLRKSLLRTADILAKEEEFWETIISSFLRNLDIPLYTDYFQYPLVQFQNSPTAMQRRLIRYLLEYVQGHLQQIDYSHIDKILDMIRNPERESTIQLPGKYSVSVENEFLIVKPKTVPIKEIEKVYHLKIPSTTHLKEWNMKICVGALHATPPLIKEIISGKISSKTAYLDFDKVTGPLTIRSWRPGDKFVPLGMKGQKKLQDFFIDRKIPLEQRHRIPILHDKSKILWIVGHQISDLVKVDKSTKKLLCIEVY
jgi:tRNA(Ile)-lysidine synthase